MKSNLHPSWSPILEQEFAKDYCGDLKNFLAEERKTHVVFPTNENVFAALEATSFEDLKVFVCGQDPYHGAGQAHGLAFSVLDGAAKPPSLQNIYKELKSDLGFEIPESGNLSKWAKQGVLLLNTTLTVREGQPLSHFGKGWETLTDHIIEQISLRKENVVFLLWGKNAQEKIPWIDGRKHLILTAAHPSPLSASRGFFGCKAFSKANEFLAGKGLKEVDWGLA